MTAGDDQDARSAATTLGGPDADRAAEGSPGRMGGWEVWPIRLPFRGAAARVESVVDLAAVRQNVRVLAAAAPGAALMAVVKADGYGHGAVPVARAALDAGATWLGVCTLDEALALRGAGITAPVLSWLHLPDEDFAPAVAAGIDLSAASRAHLAAVLDGARRAGRPARVHLKVDTGLSRNGAAPRRLAGPARRRREGRGRGCMRGRGGVVAPRARRHPRPPDARRPGRAADRGVARGGRPRPGADPAPRQLRGHADPAATCTSTWSGRASPSTGWTRSSVRSGRPRCARP